MSLKILFTATSMATGGRNGHSEASDGSIKVDLSVPKDMGGPGKPNTTTPEHLFATGYAACYGGALDYVAKLKKLDASTATITCAVSIGTRPEGGFGLTVKLHVKTQGLAKDVAESLVQEAHHTCPYSNAIRNNVEVETEVEAV